MYSLDVILRAEIVERAKAGDKCTFTGTFVVVPDVSQLSMPGVQAEMARERNNGSRGEQGVANQGVGGLKELGVRDLGYKTAFLACMVQDQDTRVRFRSPSSRLLTECAQADERALPSCFPTFPVVGNQHPR